MKVANLGTSLLTAGLALNMVLVLEPASAANNYSGKSNKMILAQSGRQTANAVIPSMPLVKVPYRSWLPKKEKPRLVLLCIHALGFSSKSYDNFGRRMAAAGIPTYALDVRGFGEWMNRSSDEAHMDFESCLTDVEQGLKTLHRAYPKTPVFLVGESMGGAIAIQAASRYPDQVNGLVSAVPSTERAGGFMKSSAIVVFKAAESGGGQVDMSPVVVDGATNDPALRRKIEADPLNRMELSKKELAQFDLFMKQTHEAAPLAERIPAMMLVAYKDKLVTPAGSVDLFSEMTTPQKLMIGDGDSGHLMLEEAQMTSEIEWILKGWLREKAATVVVRDGVASN